jgi:hypothetical protein
MVKVEKTVRLSFTKLDLFKCQIQIRIQGILNLLQDMKSQNNLSGKPTLSKIAKIPWKSLFAKKAWLIATAF